MENKIIEINDLSLPYSFQNFNIDFELNKFTVISGPNNCGKTTLIRVLTGQIKTEYTVKIMDYEMECYKLSDINKTVKAIINNEYIFKYDTVIEEIWSYTTKNKKEITEIIKKYKLTKYKNSNPNNLSNFNKLKLELLINLIQEPKILLLDDILIDLVQKEKEEIINIIKEAKSDGLTIIMSSSNLSDSIEADYLYIIDNNVIVLEGKPLEVLQNDNIINKVGLELPFMIDLSVKLRDYDLIKDIELDIDRLVNKLWN